ncbi:sulfotransferase 1A1-like [Eleutherodactylus coqui]|uniref:sulfotransferase 1A1-like n=1 Tax=Eleutherodactylus coqui TaxID=57060 RepID=UPI0034623DA4
MANRPAMKVVGGMPLLGPFAENWESVQCFQAREEDLLIATYPKSGTTWVSKVVDLMLQNGDVAKSQRGAIFERVPFLEYAVPDMSSDNLRGSEP